MENEVKAWLEDIRQAISEIYSFLPENRDFNEFLNDLKGKQSSG
jgi:uncharacterized protein with HEPN domain